MKIEFLNEPPNGPLIYCFRVGTDVYVGKTLYGPDRPLRDYARNVHRLIDGKPYRANNPDAWRRVHRAMAAAVVACVPIKLEFFPSSMATINADKKRLIRELGATLNDA